MSLHLYDTATRSQREFVPLRPGKASIYLCGLTVQGPPHIGHARNWVTTDILRRWLQHNGYDVTYVRNVTDIDDKILVKSADEDVVDFFLAVFLQNDVPAGSRAKLLDYLAKSKETTYPPYWSADDVSTHRLRTVAHLTLTLPEFQLD